MRWKLWTVLTPPSSLGIEYDELFLPTISRIMAFAEAEWIRNACEIYGDDAGEIWADDILPRMMRGTLQVWDCELIEEFLPNMLRQLSNFKKEEVEDDDSSTP